MPIIRPNALRSVQSSLRYTSARATLRTAPGRTQLVARRYASSGGHGGHGEASSDLPWLLGALAVTPPACWYLWPEPHAEHHGSHGDHDEHAGSEGGEEKEGEEAQSAEDEASQEDSAPAEQSDDKEEKGAEAEDNSDDKEEDKSDDSGDEKKGNDSDKSDKPSGSEGEGQDEPAEKKSKAEGTTDKSSPDGPEHQGTDVEGVQFKGKMKEDSAGRDDSRKSEPRPSKDSRVKRIDSGLGKNLGEGQTYDEDKPEKESQATAKKEGSSPGDITQKQKGLSNTDTKHSIAIHERDDKSKKGTGEPETAKAKGTVDSGATLQGGPNQKK